jgi:hypothetical protein
MYRRSVLLVFKNQHLIDGEHVHHAVYTGAVRAPYGLWPSSRPHVRAVLASWIVLKSEHTMVHLLKHLLTLAAR